MKTSQEEADEIGFVSSASVNFEEPYIGVTTDAVKKALRYIRIASMVIEEGGEARTSNFRKLCYNAKLVH